MGNIRDRNFQPGLIISSVNFDLITQESGMLPLQRSSGGFHAGGSY